ncbi:MAG: histidine phosphatase family protein [Isosphaeraceae bacterium]
MTETRILLLRHAETSDPDRFHGAESNIGLGERGRLQARTVAEQLAAFAPHAVYTSAMRRALETAEPIARACGLPCSIEPELHERKMGQLSGLSRDLGRPHYSEAKARWVRGELDYTHPGGESFAAIRDRVLPIFHRIAATEQGRTVVIVAHGVVIRVILTSILPGSGPADFERFAIDNAAINDLRHDGTTWRAEALNQHVGTEVERYSW